MYYYSYAIDCDFVLRFILWIYEILDFLKI